ncbi:MAG: sugar-binding protein [Mariniphaga sp.]|nr:sugar-binding protein [Mariniphaga sp.]MDD4426097.1 sugar-binding protein [Mariniphaga sp.]
MRLINFFGILAGLFFFSNFSVGQVFPRTDTLFIFQAEEPPTLNGSGDDSCWEKASWKSIDQVWMPFNNEPAHLGQESGLELWEDADDFSGRFKVVWSPVYDLIYFLVEITDDVYTDGYVYNENPTLGGGYPNFDIVEVFIDEDRSGGLHVFDGSGSTGSSWGTNAENAFSYHLAADAPEEGKVQNLFHALDIAGVNWGYPNQKVANYASHFPEFAMKKEGNTYVWEFSLIVHDDSYTPSDPVASEANLYDGKIIGLSMAYCDNDHPDENPLSRDHFFGSVEVPLSAYNEHWKQADWYGVAKLKVSPGTAAHVEEIDQQMTINTHISNDLLRLNIHSAHSGKVSFRVMTLTGKEVFTSNGFKRPGEWTQEINIQGWGKGIYLVDIKAGNDRSVRKIVVQ